MESLWSLRKNRFVTNFKDKTKKCSKYESDPNLWFSGKKRNVECDRNFKEQKRKIISKAAKSYRKRKKRRFTVVTKTRNQK